jgi:transcriptional regulator with XRE-family HTH domain
MNILFTDTPIQDAACDESPVGSSTECQTDVTAEFLKCMENDLTKTRQEVLDLRLKVSVTGHSKEDFANNEVKTRFYTGLPNFLVLLQIFNLCEPWISHTERSALNKFEQLILTLMRLKLNLSLQDLAYRFGISCATASRIFNKVISVLHRRLQFLIEWPTREVLRATMPMDFRKSFGNSVAVIIDCFEVFIERPSNLLARAQTWSTYKHHNTVKFLIGISPQGCITFISNAWGGRVSDKHLTEQSGILEHLVPGDVVLADRGFNIEDSVGVYRASLKIPAFTKGKSQLSPFEVEETRKMAHVRIHVERVIGLVRRKYQILQSRALSIEYLHTSPGEQQSLIDKIGVICCALTNLSETVVPLE